MFMQTEKNIPSLFQQQILVVFLFALLSLQDFLHVARVLYDYDVFPRIAQSSGRYTMGCSFFHIASLHDLRYSYL